MLVPVLCDYKEITQTLLSLFHVISCNKQNTHISKQNKYSWTALGRNSVSKEYMGHVATLFFHIHFHFNITEVPVLLEANLT